MGDWREEGRDKEKHVKIKRMDGEKGTDVGNREKEKRKDLETEITKK